MLITAISVSRFQISALLLALTLLPGICFAKAGEAIFVLGQAVKVSQEGAEIALHKGDIVDAGDTIITSANGQVQVRMEDGGLIAVRPGSQFKIDEFVYEGNNETDKNFFSLVEGGFRSITGAIGQTNKKAYKVKTPVATIGIRGTDYSATYCESNCGDLADGLYVGVMSGGVAVENDVGVMDLDPGQYGVIETIDSEPVYLDEAPGAILFASIANTSVAVTETDEVTTTDSSTTVALGEESITTAGHLSKSVMAYSNSLNQTKTAESITTNVNSITQGSYDALGVTWGHWEVDSSEATTVALSDGSMISDTIESGSWVSSDQAVIELPSSGTFSYGLVGGTAATDTEMGITSGNLTATFGSAPTVDADITVGYLNGSATQWDAHATSLDISKDGQFSGSFNTVNDNSSLTYDNNGTIAGAFVGDNANGAIISYNLHGTDMSTNPVDINGVGVFEQTP
ncbi:MAG: FecR family protein [Gammaproteobacteria bacterium]|nr:FecR family protein [Gammaproteobacteria bacterium]MDH5728525.1 FecR family protein [Gammaproteobacteria bacterium]